MFIASTRADARFRSFPLDGAMLFFERNSGTYVRARSEQTRTLRRTAPRVVMFGVTNACNLRCDFCSRDASRESLWTVDSAFEVLRDLSDAGTLEVAFGGGEPFAFRGFDELLVRLRAATLLALNVTTNGTLLTDDRMRRLRGVLSQVRLSLYEEAEWRHAASVLQRNGQLWGANILADREAVLTLPSVLRELAARGCHDVSLLSYVGDDASRTLQPVDEALLDAAIAASPLPIRLSVCFGHRLSAPRLFAGSDDSGDCGAGYDFVTITPDKRLQSCSFQNEALRIENADDVLRLWRAQSERLRAPSPRNGCSRSVPRADIDRDALVAPELKAWRGFSGNNSGECILVARFETVDAANEYLAQLLPGYAAREPYSEPWLELFESEGVAGPRASSGEMPHVLVAIGSTVVAEGYDAGDAFPELRALAWKRGADVESGVHVHDGITAVFAVRCEDARAAKELAASRPDCVTEVAPHGAVVIGYAALRMHERVRDAGVDWVSLKRQIEEWIASRAISIGAVLSEVSAEDFVAARQHLRDETIDEPSHLRVHFIGPDSVDRAKQFVEHTPEAEGTVAGPIAWFDGAGRRKRLAVLGYRQGAHALRVRGNDTVIRASISPATTKPQRGRKSESVPLDLDLLRSEIGQRLLDAVGSEHARIDELKPTWGEWVALSISTDRPKDVAPLIANYALERAFQLHLVVSERDSLLHTLAAVIEACQR